MSQHCGFGSHCFPSLLPTPRCPAAADCLSICGALAEGIPGRVTQELLPLCGVPPVLAAGAALLAQGQAPEVPLLGRILEAEARDGRWAVAGVAGLQAERWLQAGR